MPEPSLMTDREVWIMAGEIMAEHGKMTADYIIDRLSDDLEDAVAVENWRRIAAAVDAVNDAREHGANREQTRNTVKTISDDSERRSSAKANPNDLHRAGRARRCDPEA